MNTAELIQIVTPKKYILNGFWFGPANPKTAYILIHGLTSNAFANHPLVTPLVDVQTAVLTFSNRGSEKISRFKRVDHRKKKGYTSVMIGEAHEVFADCVDDLQGVVSYVKARGVQKVLLVGHSTGCQKSIYYLSKKNKQQNIDGVILLAPMSDYAGAKKQIEKSVLDEATRYAQNLVSQGKPHALLPLPVWPLMHDAQRFLSLYTPESEEEIFCYADPNKKPSTLQKVRIPQLIVLAGRDEYRDRPIDKIAKWFYEWLRRKNVSIQIIERAPHNFYKHEQEVTSAISRWISHL